MSHPSNFGLVDLIIILAVIGAAVATLRRGGGALATLGSVLATLLVAWLVTVAMAAWAPAPLARAAEHSTFLHTVPAPAQALHEAGRFTDRLVETITGRPGPDGPGQGPPRPPAR